MESKSQSDLSALILKFLVLASVSACIGWLAAVHVKLGPVAGGITGATVFGICSFALLKLTGAPAGLWITFGLKFFSVVAYKLVTISLVTYLIKDCRMSDAEAQGIFGAWAVFMSLATILAGSLTDALGLRRTLLIGVGLCLVTRVIMFSSSNAMLTLICGLLPLAVGEALCTPVLVVATRRFTTSAQRSVAFSVFYAILNLGFMVAYFLRDGIQVTANASGGNVDFFGGEWSPPRTLFLVSLGFELLAMVFVLLLPTRGGEAEGQDSPPVPVAFSFRKTASQTFRLFGALVTHPGFRRLLVFLVMIGLLKIVFSIMDTVLETFAEREIGPDGKASVGRLNATNSILILILAPLVGMMTRKFTAYSMVIFGGFITALSFTFMALPPAMFEGVTAGPLGEAVGRGYLKLQGDIHPYIVMILFWQIVFSIGEAFYSPRVYEYAVSIAPKGQEASYASLSAVPLLMGKAVSSAAFAGLLTAYCPAEGPRESGKMWFIAGCLVLIAPVTLLLFRRFIRVPEEGR